MVQRPHKGIVVGGISYGKRHKGKRVGGISYKSAIPKPRTHRVKRAMAGIKRGYQAVSAYSEKQKSGKFDWLGHPLSKSQIKERARTHRSHKKIFRGLKRAKLLW